MAGELVCKLLPAPDHGSVAYAVCLARPQPLTRCLRQPGQTNCKGQKRLAIPGQIEEQTQQTTATHFSGGNLDATG